MTIGPEDKPRTDEQLSAWLDGELPEVEQEFLVARLVQSPASTARLARYGLIGSCLRDRSVAVAGRLSDEEAALQLSGRVRVALEAPGSATPLPAPARRGRALPYAMAAGIAVVAVLVAVVQAPLLRSAPEPMQASVQSTAPATLQKAALSTRRMTNYLVHHGEYSGLLSARVTESHIINGRPNFVALRTANVSPP